ncbi:DUF4416 family protein [Candidatus Auribacterota bacterium]
MGTIQNPLKVKMIAGLLAGDEEILDRSKKALVSEFGPIDLQSEIIPFDFTDYYNEETGDNIIRQYISFGDLIDPGSMAGIKVKTNLLEREFAVDNKRKVNIDPGYVDLSKMVLASAKDATYRVYLGEGIYAQATLYYKGRSYTPWPWTYEDYKAETAIGFFNRVRDKYKVCVQ